MTIYVYIIQGYKQHRGYIIAQAPMEGTCRDFWKMVYDRKCGVIIMLSELMEQDKVHYNLLFLLLFPLPIFSLA